MASRKRLWIGRIAVAGCVLILLAALSTPIGGWFLSFLGASPVRWQDAYVAFEIPQPRTLDPAIERALIASAMVEGEPPAGLESRRRVHRPGTLATLRFEIFDETGAPADTWVVRALVPTLGNGTESFFRDGCPDACAEALASNRGTFLDRSGAAGIDDEWVLRMTVGETYDFGSRSLLTQDILDAQPRHIEAWSRGSRADQTVYPSRIRVTLLAACEGRVRVGVLTHLEVETTRLMVPIPRGFGTRRWTQLDGCGTLEPLPPPVDGAGIAVTPPGNPDPPTAARSAAPPALIADPPR